MLPHGTPVLDSDVQTIFPCRHQGSISWTDSDLPTSSDSDIAQERAPRSLISSHCLYMVKTSSGKHTLKARLVLHANKQQNKRTYAQIQLLTKLIFIVKHKSSKCIEAASARMSSWVDPYFRARLGALWGCRNEVPWCTPWALFPHCAIAAPSLPTRVSSH